MKLVEARQREDLFLIAVVSDADRTPVLVVIALLLAAFAGHVARSRQLGQYVHLDRLLVVSHKQLVHVVGELLLVHVIHSLVF